MKSKLMAFLLALTMVILPCAAFAEGEGDNVQWTPADFTYAEVDISNLSICLDANSGNALSETIYVVSGFSEEGTAKLAQSTDLVIPAADAEGRTVQGVGSSAFKGKGLTSVSFPANVKTANTWEGTGIEERGDFFILASAFQTNSITQLTLPEGVLYVGGNAFNGNKLTKVTLPKTLMIIANASFAKNSIEEVNFPARTDFAFQMDVQCFAINKLTSVQLPENTIKINKWAFLQNTGMEPVADTATAAEKKGGLVYMYKVKTEDSEAYIASTTTGDSNVQKLIYGAKPWSVSDFTFDEAGTTVTGLTDAGKNSMKLHNGALEIPSKNASGEDIIGIGVGATNTGVFAFTENGVKYEPTSVVLPENLETIGNFAFATAGGADQNGITSLTLPESVKSIGISAFQNATFTEVVIPAGVETIGSGAFTGNPANPVRITSVTLPEGLKSIPASMFNGQAIKNVVIPESVETIGSRAFADNGVESLTIGSAVTAIESNAFYNHRLTELEIPASVTKVGSNAFRVAADGLEGTLAKLTLNEGLTQIDGNAFARSVLESVNIPSTLINLNKSAFADNKINGEAAKVVLNTKVKAQAAAQDEYTKVVVEGTGHTVVYTKKTTTEPERIAGQSRYDTAFASADEYKDALGAKKFKNIVVACGDNYPDALAGSYLAKVKEAPVLLVAPTTEKAVTDYIAENLKDNGKVYILGGTGAVSAKFEASAKETAGDDCVVRLDGANRYETNIKILKEAGVTNEDILICTGNGYADSLSASAAGKPILLVGDNITDAQKEYLATLSTTKAYAIGGTGVVKDSVVGQYKAISGIDATRVAGANRYATSVEVAKTFFNPAACDYAVLAYAQNFPDGLSGAPVAMVYDAPILLVDNNSYALAKTFCSDAGVKNVFVLGGKALISDAVAKAMMN